MEEIDLNKKILNNEEVRIYIETLKRDYEKNMSDQKDRIYDLRNQVKDLEIKLEEYRSRARQINQALMAAVSKAEELESAAKIKYDMEIKSLKLFHTKWLSYYKKIIEKYPIDDELVKVAKFNQNMTEALTLMQQEADRENASKKDNADENKAEIDDKSLKAQKEVYEAITVAKKAQDTSLPERQYEAEKNRLNDDSQKKWNPIDNIKRYYDSKNNGNSFSMEEALHPMESLEEILKDLL